jgi:hypothetical protein
MDPWGPRLRNGISNRITKTQWIRVGDQEWPLYRPAAMEGGIRFTIIDGIRATGDDRDLADTLFSMVGQEFLVRSIDAAGKKTVPGIIGYYILGNVLHLVSDNAFVVELNYSRPVDFDKESEQEM